MGLRRRAEAIRGRRERAVLAARWAGGLGAAALLVVLATQGGVVPAAAQSSDLPSPTPYPTWTPYPTATFYPTSTPYPTFTPLATAAAEATDAGASATATVLLAAPSTPQATTPPATAQPTTAAPPTAQPTTPATVAVPASATPRAAVSATASATPAETLVPATIPTAEPFGSFLDNQPLGPGRASPAATPSALPTSTSVGGALTATPRAAPEPVPAASPGGATGVPAAAGAMRGAPLETVVPLPLVSPADYEMEPGGGMRAGHFYSQAAGGRGGYALTDELWALVQRLGGVPAIGYPASQVWIGPDGFSYQVTQGALLQWSPSTGARLGNTFQMLEAAGQDDWLLSLGVPRPITDDGSRSFDEALVVRLGWLEQPEIAARYWSAGAAAVELYGLPMSRPERFGPFIAQRFQRVAFQYWVENVPGMPPAGAVSVVLGGDLLKQAGLVPAQAQLPVPAPPRRIPVVEP